VIGSVLLGAFHAEIFLLAATAGAILAPA